jgi:hypothetical protein
VEIATASTAVGTTLRRELVVDANKQGEELRVLQQGMAHWAGLFLTVGARVSVFDDLPAVGSRAL